MQKTTYRGYNIEAYYEGGGTWYANISRSGSARREFTYGESASKAIENAKGRIDEFLGPYADEFVRSNPLTSNGKVIVAIAATAASLLTAGAIYEYIKNKKSSSGGTVINNGPQPGGGGRGHIVAAVLAPGPYTKVTSIQGNALGQSTTYLVSAPIPAGKTLAQLLQALPVGLEVDQSWNAGEVPSNWPSDDPNNSNDHAVRVSFTYSGQVSIPLNIPGVTAYKAG